MTDPSNSPAHLAKDIALRLRVLDEYLTEATPRQAAEILSEVLDIDNGLLTGVTHLVETGSRFAQSQAHRGMLPPVVWLAMGRAANELHSVGMDLDEHAEAIEQLGTPPTTASTLPPTPVASAMVVRRSR
ncbi:hypothetical protein [Streptomyces sp. TLI_146]|uniref:hypothetical protein n=1 Tax=Streptomyces sp. TLI_146 TaxID=1938858 RepID=UPI000C714DC4|nr:hypothetical protein [Streptomyces sp. TLI_146]PKV84326.1 hypothetical protein BX283_1843 [Streptomyces sp. TLI_146]